MHGKEFMKLTVFWHLETIWLTSSENGRGYYRNAHFSKKLLPAWVLKFESVRNY